MKSVKKFLCVLFLTAPAFAYENTCTNCDEEGCTPEQMNICINDPCQYVASYRFAWPLTCDGDNRGLCNQCRHVYSACHDAAADVACGWAICREQAGVVAAYPRTRHVPGLGPVCPAGMVKVR